jgi:hypothetical protein
VEPTVETALQESGATLTSDVQTTSDGVRALATSAPETVATNAPEAGAAAPRGVLAGVVLVDGRQPAWPIELVLEAPRAALPADGEVLERTSAPPSGAGAGGGGRPLPPSGELLDRSIGVAAQRTARPDARGAFEFTGLPLGWSGRLRVSEFAFADGSDAIDVARPVTGLELQLVSGPAITGRIVGPDGRPIPGLEVLGRLVHAPPPGAKHVESHGPRLLLCREDGAFRVPLRARGAGTFLLRVEDEQAGYLVRDVALPEAADGLDLGTFQLEPLRALAFTVRDTAGAPIEGAFARIDVTSFRRHAPLTDAQGRGVLAIVPDRPVDVRFFAFGHAERVLRVEPGSAPDVVLEPLAVLEVRTLGDAAHARWVRVRAPQAAFVWDAKGWDEEAKRQLELGDAAPFRPKRPGEGAVAAWEYKGFRSVLAERFALAGVVAGVPLTVELTDDEGRTVAGDTVTVGAGGRATLELGVADAGAAPIDRIEAPVGPGSHGVSGELRRRNP